MRKVWLFLGLLLPLIFSPVYAQMLYNWDKVLPRLSEAAFANPDQKHRIVILLSDQVDIASLEEGFTARKATLEERTYEVITLLKAKAEATQPDILDFLMHSSEVNQASVTPVWITNMIVAEVSVSVMVDLSWREDIQLLDLDGDIKNEPYRVESRGGEPERTVGGHEKGLDAINAPAMWALGYTGYRRVAMSIDTGVDFTHPAIDNQYRGNYVPAAQAWYESNTSNTTPFDCDEHGTHTVGTMVGLNQATDDTIGVAFNGSWIGSPGLCNSNKYLAFQWAVDPDNNASTIADQPDVINNSWYDNVATTECTSNYYKNIFDAVEAAGIAIVFSAGNNGPGVSTITPPKNINTSVVNVFSVANLNGNTPQYPINSSSSRGPSVCGGTGSLLIKPEVAAPGTNVRSCIPGGGYAAFTGTSMAAPHTSGAVLLLKEAFPALTGIQIKEALYYSAIDMGVPGEDNDYGMGLIDVKAAYDYLIQQGFSPAIPVNENNLTASSISNLSSNSCASFIFPLLNMTNNGNDTVTSALISYAVSGGITNTINWTGSLLPGNTALQVIGPLSLSPGNYTLTVQITSVNNTSDDRPEDNQFVTNFTVISSNTPFVNSVTVCENSNAVLTAQNPLIGTIQWYTQAQGGTAVGSGNVFVTPPLTSNTNYYADVVQTTTTGKPNNSGSGQYDIVSSDRYLVFDCFNRFTLKKATVYSENAASGVIQLRSSDGVVLQSVPVSLNAGANVVTIDFDIMPGQNYQLGTSALANLYRNDNFAGYPINVPNILSIKTSNIGSTRYYSIYNWEIEYGTPCGRGGALVTVVPGNVVADFTPSTTQVDLTNTGYVTFSDNSQGANSWLWDFGDGVQDTQQNPAHIYTATGDYTVVLQAGNGTCSDMDTVTMHVFGISDMENHFVESNLKIYPNPTDDQLFLDYDGNIPDGLNLILVDIMGKVIYDIRLIEAKNSISLGDLPDGVYFVKVKTPSGEVTSRTILKAK